MKNQEEYYAEERLQRRTLTSIQHEVLGNRKEKIIGHADILIRPTKHFRKRFEERIGDIMPEINPESKFQVSGILVQSHRPRTYYLDIAGVGRFVIRQEILGFIGITVIPQIFCHPTMEVSLDVST